MANLQATDPAELGSGELPPVNVWYQYEFTAAEAKRSKSRRDKKTDEEVGDNPMISVVGKIVEHEKYEGRQFFDNLLTCSTHPERGTEINGASFSVKKFQGMGFDTKAEPDSSDDALCADDEQLATKLIGRRGWVKFKIEPIQEQNADGKWVPKKGFDDAGKEIVLKRLVPAEYAVTPPTAGKSGGSKAATPPKPPAPPRPAPSAPQGDDATPPWEGKEAEAPAKGKKGK